MIYLAVDSGMRWGELIGLQRKKLDFANRRVQVVDQLVRTAEMFHRTEPKTFALVRSITISRMTAEIIGSHLERYAGVGRDGLVLPNAAGNPLAESSFYVPLQERTGIVRYQAALPRPSPHQRGVGYRWRSAPEGNPSAHGTFVDRRHARSLWALTAEPRRSALGERRTRQW